MTELARRLSVMVTETTTLDVDRDHDLGLGIVLVSGVGQTDLLLTLGDGGIGQQTGLSARNRHPILTGAAQRSARCRGVVLHRQRGIRRLHGLYNRPDDCVLRSGRVERAVLAVDQRDGNAGVQLNAGGQFGLLLDGILLGRTRNADLILSVSVGSRTVSSAASMRENVFFYMIFSCFIVFLFLSWHPFGFRLYVKIP